MMRSSALRELYVWKHIKIRTLLPAGLREALPWGEAPQEHAESKRMHPNLDASFSITNYELPIYHVAFNQPRSSIALTTREMATMYAASRI